MFMLEKLSPINDVYSKIQNHSKVREKIILEKSKMKSKPKFKSTERGTKDIITDPKEFIASHASQPSTAKTNHIILNPVMKG